MIIYGLRFVYFARLNYNQNLRREGHFIIPNVKFLFLDRDISLNLSYIVYISQLVHYDSVLSDVSDLINEHNLCINNKYLILIGFFVNDSLWKMQQKLFLAWGWGFLQMILMKKLTKGTPVLVIQVKMITYPVILLCPAHYCVDKTVSTFTQRFNCSPFLC